MDGRTLARPEELALLRLLDMPAHDFSEQLAVPAQYALEMLGAMTVTLLRLERSDATVRSMVTVGQLSAGQRRTAANRVLRISQYGELLDLAGTTPLAMTEDDGHLPAFIRTILATRGLHGAIAAPVHVEGRPWGVLWATKRTGPLDAAALALAGRCAARVGPMVALAERLRAMSQLAFEDPLTGLGNRRRLDDALAAVLHESADGCTVVVCDVNGLKAVNDEHGHQAGDAVIVAVADALSHAVSAVAGAVAVRTGGDEFTLVLPGQVRPAALGAVETAAWTLAEQSITISCGVATVAAGSPARTALALADSAQYAAKRRGALVMAVSETEPTAVPRPRRLAPPGHDRRALPRSQGGQLSAAIQLLAAGLATMPERPRTRLEWLGEALLEPLDLDQWSVSRVGGPRAGAGCGERKDDDAAAGAGPDIDAGAALEGATVVVEAVGVRANLSADRLTGDLLNDDVFALADYPLTSAAVLESGWFAIAADDPAADPAEVRLLHLMQQRYVVAVGWSQGTEACLLEVYGHAPDIDLDLLGATVAVMASAVLGRAVSPVGTRRARMGG